MRNVQLGLFGACNSLVVAAPWTIVILINPILLIGFASIMITMIVIIIIGITGIISTAII